jgi:hypothetical protein
MEVTMFNPDVYTLLLSIQHNMSVRAERAAAGDTAGAEAAFAAAEDILRGALDDSFHAGCACERENDAA